MPELTEGQIADWVITTTGIFHIMRALDGNVEDTPQARSHLRVIFHRLKDKGLVEPVSARGDGWYRKIEKEALDIDLVNADETKIVPLKLPFELHKHALLRPKNIMVVAGSKSAGKTAFIHNILKLNMGNPNYPITLYDTQIGKEALKMRFMNTGIPIPPPFAVKRRYAYFADPIKPNEISIIDFIRVDTEGSFKVADEMKAIRDKLEEGIAIIALQKPRGRDEAYGGAYSAFDVELYLSLDRNRLKIVYCKNPADPTVNPENMIWTFSGIKDGAEFINPQKSNMSAEMDGFY